MVSALMLLSAPTHADSVSGTLTIEGRVFAPKSVLALRRNVGEPDTVVILTLKPLDQRRILDADVPASQFMYDPAVRDTRGNFQFLTITLPAHERPWLTAQVGAAAFELQAGAAELDHGLIAECDEVAASDSRAESEAAYQPSIHCSLQTKTPFATTAGDARVDLRFEAMVHSKMPAECGDCGD
jgi:hypothetical protein